MKKELKDNLWKPGQSGNPRGRPRGTKNGIRAQIMRLLARRTPEGVLRHMENKGVLLPPSKRPQNAETVAWILLLKALSGNAQALRTLLRHVDPPLAQSVELSGPGGKPIQTDNIKRKIDEMSSEDLRRILADEEKQKD